MNALLGLALAQAATLPPPPAPKSANSVSPLSIVLVVVIVLGSVAMIALSSRRIKRRPTSKGEALPSNLAPDASAETDQPVFQAGRPVDPNLLARLRRVTGSQAAERRRLGNRKSKGEADVVVSENPAPAWLVEPSRPSAEPVEDDGDEATPAGVYPEPIPIRRRAAQRWQDEPVIAPGTLSSSSARSWAASGAALQGLTNDEVSQLEAPRQTARRVPPAPRLKPDVIPPKSEARSSAGELLAAELSATVRELLFCANVGEVLHGFALYSDAFLFRTMDDTGMSEDEFRVAFASQPAKPVGEWTRLLDLRNVDRLTPDLVEATILYASPAGEDATKPERFRFIRNPEGQGWLVDDIRSLE